MSTFISILKEKTETPKINRIGLQIRKDSTTFSDNATGSIPQIDAIIKTTDGKIYKATQNLNSTYTDYNGNKTTTTNAAEPVGASMCEKFVKEYEWRNQENTNKAQAKVVYGNGIYLSSTIGNVTLLDDEIPQWSDYRNLCYSKNGKKWNQILLDNAIKTEIPNINEYMISDICYGNGKFVVAIITNDYHLLFGYSTNAIDWTITQFNGLANDYSIAVIKICYGNNKYSGLATIATDNNEQSCYSIYSTDGVNWNSNIVKTNFGNGYYPDLVRDICYGNNRFISIVSIYEDKKSMENMSYKYNLNDNLYYSTDGINWTSTIALSTFDHLQRIFYINNKFYLCSNMNYAYSTDGINWTKYTPKWSDGTVMDDNSFLSTQIMCKYDNNSLLGLFIDHSKNCVLNEGKYEGLTGYAICKSSDGITWDKLYNIDIHVDEDNTASIKGLHPSNMIYVNDSICIVSNSAFTQYAYTRWIHYYWTVNKKDNIELSHIITDQPSVMIYFPISQTILNQVEELGTIDTTELEKFKEGDLDKHSTGAYRFSGWSQTGNITFTKDTPRVTEITGTWNWVDMVKYSYSWNAPSYSDLTGLVTLPTGGSAYVGDTVSVDTKYNSDSNVELLTPTYITNLTNLTSTGAMVCYGNHMYLVVNGGKTANYYYSTDATTWTAGTLPASINVGSICYGNGKFIINNIGVTGYYYSTDAVNWTLGGLPNVNYQVINFCNDKFIALPSSTTLASVIYSIDGINWTSTSFTHSYAYAKACYGNGIYICNTKGANNAYAYSTDGINWIEKTVSKSNGHDSVTYGNGLFIMSGYEQTYLYSTDGINWNNGSFHINGPGGTLVFANGIFVFLRNPYIISSFDGINWIQSKTTNTAKNTTAIYSKACYGDNKMVFNDGTPVNGTNINICVIPIPTSYYQFSGWNPSTDFIINENKTISGTWSKKNKLKVSYSWSNQPSGMKSKVPGDEYYHYGDNVMVDTTYNNKSGYKGYPEFKFYESDNYFSCFKYFNNTYYGILHNSKGLITSTDGITWSDPIFTDIYLTNICYNNGIYVLTTQTGIKYSTDLISYNNTNVSSQSYYDCVYGKDKFIAFIDHPDYSYHYAYSTDGITWTTSVLPRNNSEAYRDICYADEKFLVCGSTGLYYSVDGINWNTAISSLNYTWPKITYGNGLYVVLDYIVSSADKGTSLVYSQDLINWETCSISSHYITSPISIGFIDEKFIIFQNSSLKYTYRVTSDFNSWVSVSGVTNISTVNGLDGTIKILVANNKILYGGKEFFTICDWNITYYQFSGWNKSDFNITADTSITASWNTVSSGDGLNFID